MGDFIIWLLIMGIFFMIVNKLKPKEPPSEPEKPPEPEKPESKPKPEGMVYTDDFKEKIAIESINGKSDDDIIKENPTVTADDVKEWKKNLTDSIANLKEQIAGLKEQNEKLSGESKKLNSKVERLEEICQIFIGDGWKEKTGYKYL
ncbi:MAG: hypothetical protein K2H28_07430 [Ruminococcus sp.]|nr:hypothetical protein [Ruminococcus sp.]